MTQQPAPHMTANQAAALGSNALVEAGTADVANAREHRRQSRLGVLGILLGLVLAYLVMRRMNGMPIWPGLPPLPDRAAQFAPAFVLILLLGGTTILPLLAAGKSPHVLYRPGDISTSFDDVVGIDGPKHEVIRSLNLFLAHRTFSDRMGGTPRRALLFEGPPGTGKTYMAKAMAKEAGVPFLFVSSSAFQSMFYGQTNRKIRSYFRAVRKTARREGGAIGFIEEIDAIAGARSGMREKSSPSVDPAMSVNRSSMSEGTAGIVNELLIQMQSFDEPTRWHRTVGKMIGGLNRFLPQERMIRQASMPKANVLIIAATNRADDLDPALLRPGRFDRSIHFDAPGKSGRRDIIDYYLAKKSHEPELDDNDCRQLLAGRTAGYTPVMIENLFDEALMVSLRHGRVEMTMNDITEAKLAIEIGTTNPVEYTEREQAIIATHEAGHALVAHVVAPERSLEVLSIIKRRDALGLLAHRDIDERYTQTRSELIASIEIALGGMVSEELFFGESGTGPGADLAGATRTAAMMVGALGMTGSLISFQAVRRGPLDADVVGTVLGDERSRLEVEALLMDAKRRVRDIITANRHVVEALRDALLADHELVGGEITRVIGQARAAASATPELIDLRPAPGAPVQCAIDDHI
jgi:cell division protease FtsH